MKWRYVVRGESMNGELEVQEFEREDDAQIEFQLMQDDPEMFCGDIWDMSQKPPQNIAHFDHE